MQIFRKRGIVEKNSLSLEIFEDFSIKKDIFRRLKKSNFNLKKDLRGVFLSMVFISNMILWRILIGMILASVSAITLSF